MHINLLTEILYLNSFLRRREYRQLQRVAQNRFALITCFAHLCFSQNLWSTKRVNSVPQTQRLYLKDFHCFVFNESSLNSEAVSASQNKNLISHCRFNTFMRMLEDWLPRASIVLVGFLEMPLIKQHMRLKHRCQPSFTRPTDFVILILARIRGHMNL